MLLLGSVNVLMYLCIAAGNGLKNKNCGSEVVLACVYILFQRKETSSFATLTSTFNYLQICETRRWTFFDYFLQV